jgi:hypothetical protein
VHNSRRRRLGPQRIGCFALEAELLAYLRGLIQQQWPNCRVDATDSDDAVARWRVDLWLCSRVPTHPPLRMMLCLSAPGRPGTLTEIGAGIWQLPAPYYRDTFLDAIFRLWVSAMPDVSGPTSEMNSAG